MDMDEQMIKRESGQYDLELVQRLYLDNQLLRRLAPSSLLEQLTSLVDLSLARNELSCVQGLATLQQLRRLDLSCNRLASVKGLESLVGLQWLDVSYNRLSGLEDALDSLRRLPRLESLKLGLASADKADPLLAGAAVQPNACADSPKYPLLAFEYLPQLLVLDGALVSVLREAAMEAALGQLGAGSAIDGALSSAEGADSWLGGSGSQSARDSGTVAALAETQAATLAALQQDGSHLLRKADKLLASASAKW